MNINDFGDSEFSKIKWIRWRWRIDDDHDNGDDRTHRQTKITPGHKPPVLASAIALANTGECRVDDRNDRSMQPHIGMNPFLNGSTYLNDIMVQNSMLRGESVRDSDSSSSSSSLNALNEMK